jgi:hypothetical protein
MENKPTKKLEDAGDNVGHSRNYAALQSIKPYLSEMVKVCNKIEKKNCVIQLSFYFKRCNLVSRSRDSSVGIATCYGLDGRGWTPGKGEKLFSTPRRPDRFWGSTRVLSDDYRRLFPRG